MRQARCLSEALGIHSEQGSLSTRGDSQMPQPRHHRSAPAKGGRLANRGGPAAPIKAPAMNITLGTAGTLGLGAVLTAWHNGFEFIFGKNAPNDVRKDVLIATIFAIVIVAS